MTRSQKGLTAILSVLIAVNVQLVAELRYALQRIEDKGDARTALVREDVALTTQARALLQRVDDRAPAFKDRVSREDDDNQWEKRQLHALAVQQGCAIDLPVTRPLVPFPSAPR